MAATKVTVRLRARAGRDELGGFRGGKLLAKVTAPPVDGRANRAVCRLIADVAGVPRSRVTILRGRRSRDKLIQVDGIGAEELRRALTVEG